MVEDDENDFSDDNLVLDFVVVWVIDDEYFQFDDDVFEVGILVLLVCVVCFSWKWFIVEECILVMCVIVGLCLIWIVIGGNVFDVMFIDVYEGFIV